MDPKRLVKSWGRKQRHDLVQAMWKTTSAWGPAILAPMKAGEALTNALGMSPAEVIRNVKNARLRGRAAPVSLPDEVEFTRPALRGGASSSATRTKGTRTFKDRVILTNTPTMFSRDDDRRYAIGAAEAFSTFAGVQLFACLLESVLAARRAVACWQERLRQDRVRFRHPHPDGAGAYICGEERRCSVLRRERGDPKTRRLPAQKGYWRVRPPSTTSKPTAAQPALERGAAWFAAWARTERGTKLLSISGDLRRRSLRGSARIKLQDVLKLAGRKTHRRADRRCGGQMVDPPISAADLL